MSTYVYQNKTLHINRHRRKEDKAPNDFEFQETDYDGRRRKIRDGILIVEHDRRQQNDPNYSGPERRSGVDRRKNKSRRADNQEPKAARYRTFSTDPRNTYIAFPSKNLLVYEITKYGAANEN
ncbi:MAG: hypothetical protein PVJ20_02890 [Desulfobacterales bacterium]|jgi:hypothetical protein